MTGRTLRTLGAACTVALLASACAAKNDGAAADGEIVIGADIELSGSAAQGIGEAHNNSLKMVVEQINGRGVKVDGKKYTVKLEIRDNKSDPAESLNVYKSFVQDKAVAVVGGGTTPTTMSFVNSAEQDGMPTISMGSSGAIVMNTEARAMRKYVFKTPANPDVIFGRMVDEFKRLSITKIGFLHVDNAYGNSGAKAATDRATATGDVELVDVEKFSDKDKEYTTQITKLMAKQPQAIVVWAIQPMSGIAAKNIKDTGFTGKVFFDSGAGAELFIKGAGAAAEGMYMVHPAVLAGSQLVATSPSSISQKQFFQQYSAKYGNYSGFASYSADALRMFVAAIEKANSLDRQKIRDALENLQYDGVTGRYEYSKDNHGGVGSDSITTLVVRNGTWELAH